MSTDPTVWRLPESGDEHILGNTMRIEWEKTLLGSYLPVRYDLQFWNASTSSFEVILGATLIGNIDSYEDGGKTIFYVDWDIPSYPSATPRTDYYFRIRGYYEVPGGGTVVPSVWSVSQTFVLQWVIDQADEMTITANTSLIISGVAGATTVFDIKGVQSQSYNIVR